MQEGVLVSLKNEFPDCSTAAPLPLSVVKSQLHVQTPCFLQELMQEVVLVLSRMTAVHMPDYLSVPCYQLLIQSFLAWCQDTRQ